MKRNICRIYCWSLVWGKKKSCTQAPKPESEQSLETTAFPSSPTFLTYLFSLLNLSQICSLCSISTALDFLAQFFFPELVHSLVTGLCLGLSPNQLPWCLQKCKYSLLNTLKHSNDHRQTPNLPGKHSKILPSGLYLSVSFKDTPSIPAMHNNLRFFSKEVLLLFPLFKAIFFLLTGKLLHNSLQQSSSSGKPAFTYAGRINHIFCATLLSSTFVYYIALQLFFMVAFLMGLWIPLCQITDDQYKSF